MEDDGKCTAFKYEPTKRKPEFARVPAAVEIDAEDFQI